MSTALAVRTEPAVRGRSMDRPSVVLRRVRELLTPDYRWCKGAAGRDKNGVPTTVDNAFSYCLSGAWRKCGGELRALDAILGCTAIFFNDYAYTTHRDLILLLDERIEYNERRERLKYGDPQDSSIL